MFRTHIRTRCTVCRSLVHQFHRLALVIFRTHVHTRNTDAGPRISSAERNKFGTHNAKYNELRALVHLLLRYELCHIRAGSTTDRSLFLQYLRSTRLISRDHIRVMCVVRLLVNKFLRSERVISRPHTRF